MSTTFADYSGLPDEVKKHLLDLECFLGDIDCLETVDGTLDAEAAAIAFNGVVAFIKSLSSAIGQQPMKSKAPQS